MLSNENKPRGWRALLGIAAIASVVVGFGAVTPAKAHGDDDDHEGYWHRDRDEDREERHEAWERHEWAEEHPYAYGYDGYYAQPPAYYYARPRVYYPPQTYYAPPVWGGFSVNIR